MYTESERFLWIDYLKVFAIVLVVLGHSIQTLNVNYEQNIVFKYIYSFHMPLFMFISGFLSYRGSQGITFKTVKRRFFQLLVPFVCLPITICLLKGKTDAIFIVLANTFYTTDSGLWFLHALFFIILISYGSHLLARQLKIKEEIVSFVVVYGLNFLQYMKGYAALGFYFISIYLIYFTLGYYVKKYELLVKKHFTPIFWISFIFYAFNGQFYLHSGKPTFYQYLNCGNIFAYFYKLVLGFSGCLFAYLFFKRYFKLPENRLITFIASNTLGIYAIHQNLFQFFHVENYVQNVFLQTFLLFSFVFLFTMLLVVIFSRFKITAFCFLGK